MFKPVLLSMRIIASTTFSSLDRGTIWLHEVIASLFATDGKLTTKPLPSLRLLSLRKYEVALEQRQHHAALVTSLSYGRE
jgi:hypothetical protein